MFRCKIGAQLDDNAAGFEFEVEGVIGHQSFLELQQGQGASLLTQVTSPQTLSDKVRRGTRHTSFGSCRGCPGCKASEGVIF
jgi:hypothetical protein